MKILVTGAAGYIGSILTPCLLSAGHSVLALDNFMYRQNSLLDCCNHQNLEIIRADARNREVLAKCLAQVDAILPLACLTGAPLCKQDPTGACTIILDATWELLRLRSKQQMIIYPTTNSGYGLGEKDKFCTEETPLRPISLYGTLKAQAEQEFLNAGNSITLRLATVFGASPRMRTDLLVNDFVLRAVRDRFVILFEAHFRRNYVHIRDVADTFIFCLHNFQRLKDQPYNVGLSHANLSKTQLCEQIKKQIPDFYFMSHDIGKDPDKRDYIVSNAKIEVAGLKAKRTLEEGIAELKKAYAILPAHPFGNV